jgi:predicted N-acetyltransferase YhbS
MGGLSSPRELSAENNLEGFSSGSEALDSWLHKHAHRAVEARSSKVFVVCEGSDVVGYYALAAGQLLREELPKDLRPGLPRHPIPTVLLARLAVHQRLQGSGLGRALVADAIKRAVSATAHLAAFALVTNAKAESRVFYENLGFIAAANDASLMLFPLVFEDL